MRNATIRASRSWWVVSSAPHAAPSPAAARASNSWVFSSSSAMQHILTSNCAHVERRDRELMERLESLHGVRSTTKMGGRRDNVWAPNECIRLDARGWKPWFVLGGTPWTDQKLSKPRTGAGHTRLKPGQ